MPVPYAQNDFIIFRFVYHLDYITVHWAINIYWSDPQCEAHIAQWDLNKWWNFEGHKHSPFGWANQKSTVRNLICNIIDKRKLHIYDIPGYIYILDSFLYFSSTAVRFGRVPKKEKARIIEQMQKNTMHSQTSQMMTMFQNSRDLIQAIVGAHHHTCVFTLNTVRQMREEAIKNNNYVNCPAQMVNKTDW